MKQWRTGRFFIANSASRGVLLALAYSSAVLLAWHVAVVVGDIKPFVLPKPSSVLRSLYTLPTYYARHFLVTGYEALAGLAVGFLGGVGLGLLIRYCGRLGRLVQPLVVASQVFPKEALAPLLVVYIGFGPGSKITVSALICFFPAVINTVQGLRAAPEAYERLLHTLGATRLQRFWNVHLPYAASYILAALRMSAAFSVVGAVVGEFVGASAGLGHVIRAANADIGVDRVYAALLLLGVLGGALYGGALLLENVVFRRFTTITD